ncbi:SipW-dependent-type signal peptide-containing protein [Cryobacterium roopkundense]|uniref:Putative ribosomally synthesized peptide with SipW-like signal peptide n=1 Tax=Cryobacterium roopkundense TaxID=1001240 RepID=A0A7W9A0I3_9MICO|nr:SipW-dependent-type signal peptide-containing protein [Cryobacterium roopkundense]MBB5639454.1 putative ribosomally synthesized peptide with SipW-like signal peptide [Cryobacterium roopkundense]MBB5643631.1 putative ribosomally synthesized peptide with SipW-like signal peptide [Cryobacterium roopkundense]
MAGSGTGVRGRHARARARRARSGRRRGTRLRALLAGGLVLGIGATVTVASWNDSEYASATFTSSVFDTESSVQGAAYADNVSAPGPVVTFSGAGLSPGVSRYLSVNIRSKTNSVAGAAVLSGAVVTGTDAATLGSALRYRVVRGDTACTAAAFTAAATYVVGTPTVSRVLTGAQEPGVSNLLAAAPSTGPGAATGFCFEVTLPAGADNALQGKAAGATWLFTATSE